MSLLSTWGEKDKRSDDSLTIGKISQMSVSELEKTFFDALRGGEIGLIRTILQVKRSLLKTKLYGFEGHDVYNIIPNSKTKRCYSYTGKESDGYFYPLHVAAEAGHKSLIILLVQAGADQNVVDYRNETPEQKSTGDGLHAFYELRGLRFQSEEKYEGQYDRTGARSKQGSLYFKAEGYHETSHLLYRGGWKDNLYHGHGSLYYVGSSVLKYFGRFRNGLYHGVGTLFDPDGEKIYHGNFREGLRDGRGEEYSKGKLIYKGEMVADVKHGYGMSLISEGHRFLGHFERGVMTGVGVYYMPNGDRFEGMFLNNRRDGPGTFYKKDPVTGSQMVTSSIFSMGRKERDIDTPFSPKISDIPSLVSRVGLKGKSPITKNTGVADDEDSSNAIDLLDWKTSIGHLVRLTPVDAKEFEVEEELKDLVVDVEEGTNDDEFMYHDVDDVHGFHFVENPALFVAYAYVSSAAKTFEKRKVTRDFKNIPDFEQIYHLVIDAVDEYNEKWEKEWKNQEAKMLEQEKLDDIAQKELADSKFNPIRIGKSENNSNVSQGKVQSKDRSSPITGKDDKPQSVDGVKGAGKSNTTADGKVVISASAFADGAKMLRKTESKVGSSTNPVESKPVAAPIVRGTGEQTKAMKFLFMSENEKKEEELKAKQKSRKNIPLLDPIVEYRLGVQVLEKLEEEIVKELEMEVEITIEEGDGIDQIVEDEDIEEPSRRGSLTSNYEEDNQKWSLVSKITNMAPTFNQRQNKSPGAPQSGNGNHSKQNITEDQIGREVGRIESRMVDKIDLSKVRTGRKNRRTSTGTTIVVNEFASEILYLMRTATDLLMPPSS